MVASNNSGGFRPTADVQRALADAGFAFRAPEISWNAPANQPTQARNENAQREAEERQKAQQAIENNVTNIRSALANPNIDQATRAKLEADLGKLEGLRTQLDGGRASAAQVSASVASITSSVSASVASVSAGGAMGSAQMAAIAAQAGVSVEYARSLGGHVITPNMTLDQVRQTTERAADHVQNRFNRNNDRIRALGGQLAGTDEQREKWERDIRAGTRAGASLEEMERAKVALREIEEETNKLAAQTPPGELRDSHNDNRAAARALRQDLGKRTQLEISARRAAGVEVSADQIQQMHAQNEQRLQIMNARNADVQRLAKQDGDAQLQNRVERGVANQTVAVANNRDDWNKTPSQLDVARTETPQNQQVADGADTPAQANHTPRTTTPNRALFGTRATPAATTVQATQTVAQAATAANAEQKPTEAPQVAANEQTREAAREAARPAAQAQVKPDGEASKTEAAKPTQVAAAAPAAQSAAAARL